MLMRTCFGVAMLGALTLSGCTVKYSPLINSVDLTQTDFSNAKNFKKGEGCRTLLFGALPIGGSSSVVRAIINGNISHVKAVDYRVKNFFIITQSCVTVYGE
jgi:hypothetical protein